MIELEQQRDEQKLQEELECQKKFKARPVPASVFMPLYDEIMQEQELRRRLIKQRSQELIQSMTKPFSFAERDERLKEKFSKSERVHKKNGKNQFKASPFPAEIFDSSIPDKMQEEEAYRQITKRMRAKELMKSASLPTSMKENGKEYTEARSRQKMLAEKAKKMGFTVDDQNKFKPKINKSVPDFEGTYSRFLKNMEQSKKPKETTVCKPFNLHSTSRKENQNPENNRSLIQESNQKLVTMNKSTPSSRPLSRSMTGDYILFLNDNSGGLRTI